ncbi:MAG: hypothetical protein ACRYHQ_22350 [Janthinobacterium lividum]
MNAVVVCLGLVTAALAELLPTSGGAETIKQFDGRSGSVVSDGQSEPRPLTGAELAIVNNWLVRHRIGWRSNFASPPPPTASISLDTERQRSALVLEFWTGPNYPGWQQAVAIEVPAGSPTGLQSFNPEELAPLLDIVRR